MPTTESIAARSPRVGFLPAEVDSFIGRRRELDEIRKLFGTFPLVTLIGMGGVGKTRLAIRAASKLGRLHADRVWFIGLGDLHDPALLVPTLAESVGVLDKSVTLQSVVGHLSTDSALLVLDNCEHLLDEVATTADALLRMCPGVRIVATSRERLGIHGEGTLEVDPLAVPRAQTDTHPDALPRFDAVGLFTERAQAVAPDFMLTKHNSADVGRICRQLDGVPLALELAAVWLRTLSPRELADRLDDRYQMLTRGSRVAPPRHQTLRLCVDWSYEQCTAAEQLLWRRISIFVGSFELDEVEAICGSDDLAQNDVLAVLSGLVDKSIVSRDYSDESTSFRQLETLRQYGQDRLKETGELADLRRRHRDWYESLSRLFHQDMIGPRQLHWTSRVDRELPNVRAAMEYSLTQPNQSISAQRIAYGLHLYWISRGLLSEGRYWLGRALEADANNPASSDRVAALFTEVTLAGIQGDIDSATRAARECRQAAKTIGDPADTAYADNASGMLALFSGELPEAVTHLARAAAGHRSSGDPLPEVEALIGVALAHALQGDSEKAVECHARVLSLTQPLDECLFQAFSLWAVGIAMWRNGEIDQAATMLERSLGLRRRMHDLTGSLWCVEGLAFVAESSKDFQRAAVLLGASASLSRDAGTRPATFPDLVTAYSEAAGRVRRAVGDSAYDKAFDRGRNMNLAEAVAFALDEPMPHAVKHQETATLLTPREQQVAALVAEGLANRAIAEKLVISPRTAENHVENILTKLGLTSRTQVASWVAHLPTPDRDVTD